jgi:para-nitrobenzyl esterase
MKKLYTFITGSCMVAASVVQLNAQCPGNRYHDFIFTAADTTKNIIYGSSITYSGSTQSQKLDVYKPHGDTDTLRPLIIWAHPGSFVSGDKSDAEMARICTDFAKMGYVTASINYRLFMTNLISSNGPDSNDAGAAVMRGVHDGKAAVRFFRKNFTEGGNTYGIDTSQIFFGGLSAGGFIALHLAYMDQLSEFPSYIDTTGTTSGSVTGQKGLHGGIEGLSGNPGYSSKVKAILNLSGALSDTAWIHAGDTPLICTHATGDGTVPFGSSLIYLNPPNTYPIQVVDGSSSVIERANEVGVVNCFKPYYVNQHVPESDPLIYDTTLCLLRNFLEHFTCGIPLDCNYSGKVAGINDITKYDATAINLYPNPASTSVTVDLKELGNKNVDIELYDAMGRKVRTASKIKAEHYTISRDNLPRGIYSVNILVDGKVYSKKVMFE